ncbi:hypothetical protein NC652_030867 [Populus alba x Populus x berolinensis]|nr:hypothetical protein NC652_030867 [Populus alba x Populus x berolinensis]
MSTVLFLINFHSYQATWPTQNLPRLKSGHKANRNSDLKKAPQLKTSKLLGCSVTMLMFALKAHGS